MLTWVVGVCDRELPNHQITQLPEVVSMLKADLIRPRIQVRNGKVYPRLLAADVHWVAVADAIMGIFGEHVGRSRGALDEALRDFEGDSLDYPILRGLADVLNGRATFDRTPPVDPAELRELLFGQGPVVGKGNLFQLKERPQVIEETAERLDLSPTQVESAMFADLAEEQILQEVGRLSSAKELIERYNLEVARGLLYWAKELDIHVEDGYQDVFRYIKLGGLMHTIYPAEKGYDITLHGPISPFVKSTIRYGLQFARFMPALLLCETWQMVGQVRPPGQDQFLRYELDDSTELRGYFKGAKGFASRLEAGFAAEFEEKYNRAERVWELAYEDEIIPVGDTVMIPDFSLTHRKDGRRALVEIVGFWHPNYLRSKLRKIREAKRADLIVLVYESANVAEGAFEEVSAGEVLMFKSKPVLKEVMSAVERSAV
jgi:predicted nuclease of restriction endonuclease-like RecB superfamily